MKKAIVATSMVMTLGLGFAAIGEAKEVNITGCIKHITMRMIRSTKKTSINMRVGNKKFAFLPYPGHIKQRSAKYALTTAQSAAWEPVVQHLRAAAIAKIKVSIWYDDSSKWVKDIRLRFGSSCK